jgi:apolipoprotein D and lipocalin family protein
MNRVLTLGLAAGLTLAAVAVGGIAAAAEAKAPEPAKPIDAAKFYAGRWYEIGRTPMSLTNGCVAGTTDYYTDASGKLIDRDACRKDTPEGKEKVFAGPVTILDPGQNTKITVHYKVAGLITFPKTWWMLDHGDDYGWFIVSDPSFKTVSLFTRNPRPSREEVGQLTDRAKSLGYDTSKLEFPAQFPPGEGAEPAH